MNTTKRGKVARTVAQLVAGMKAGVHVWADASLWAAAERRKLIRWNGDEYVLVVG